MTLTSAQIDTLLTAGSLAPSGGNTQPWRAIVRGNVIELSLDDMRATSVLDPCADAAIMALGSFAENVIVASSAIALRPTVAFQPDETAKMLVRIALAADAAVARDALCDAIATRRTNRRPHVGPAIPEVLIDDLRAACRRGQGHTLLTIGSVEHKRAVAGILSRADRVRVRNRALHHEMFSELRWNLAAAARSGDGIEVRSLELPLPGRLLLRLLRSRVVARTLLPARTIELLSQQLLASTSHLCALTMPTPLTPVSWFEAGRTLQRVWLTAERHRLAIQPWTVLPFLARHRECPKAQAMGDNEQREVDQLAFGLRDAFGLSTNDHLFFVFRLFRAPHATGRALRRPWSAFARVDAVADDAS